jgi:Tfp pilus assembly protein PilF
VDVTRALRGKGIRVPGPGRTLFHLGGLLFFTALAGCGALQARLELKEGNKSYLDGDYENAIAHYQKAIEHVPDKEEAWLNQAYSHVALSRGAGSDMEERKRRANLAVESFLKYVEALGDREIDEDSDRPGRERVDQHILTLYLDSGQPDQAVRFLEERLERDPEDVTAIQMLSTIAADRGDLKAAADWQRRRIAIEAEEPEAHYAFGVFAWRASYYNQTTDTALRDSLLDAGVAELEKALSLKPDYFEALSYMTLLYREKAKYAGDPVAVAAAERMADEYRQRAMALRKNAPPGDTEDTSGGKAPDQSRAERARDG